MSFLLWSDRRIDANKPIKNDMESLPVDAPPPSTTITLLSNKPDDKNRSSSQTKDNKQPTAGEH